MKDKLEFIETPIKIEIYQDIVGSILDIGGGGECVIGQIFGKRVIAIDRLKEELDEAPDCCEKRLMDATELQFPDKSFDNVTFFYSLMYMNCETQRKAIHEAIRVLKQGGICHIWDTDIYSAYPEPFVVNLDVVSEKVSIHTSYGIVKNETQDADSVLEYMKDVGLNITRFEKREGQFFIVCEKTSK